MPALLQGTFAAARAAAPSIIFIDELDALAPAREGGSAASRAPQSHSVSAGQSFYGGTCCKAGVLSSHSLVIACSLITRRLGVCSSNWPIEADKC